MLMAIMNTEVISIEVEIVVIVVEVVIPVA